MQAYDEPPRGSLQKMPLEILDNIFSHLLVLDDKHNHVFDFTGELKRQPEVINLALLSVNRRLSEAAKSYFIANNDLVIVDYDYGFFKQCMRAGGQRYLARVKRHMPRAHQMMEIEWTAKCPGENAKGQRGSIILRFADFGRLTKLLQLEYFRRRGKMLYCDWNESEEPTYIQRIHNCPWTLIVKFRTSKFHRRDFSMPQYCALARKLLQPLAAMNGSDHIIKTFGAGDNADVCLELLIARNNHPVADVTAMGWCLAEIAVFWRSEIQKICLPTDKNAVHLQQLFRSMHYFTHFLINNGLFDFGEPFAGDMAGVVEPPVTSPEFVESYRQVVLVAYIDSVAIGLKALCIESPHNCHQNPAFAVWVNTLCVIPSGRRDVPVETLANAYWGLATAASEAEHAIELLQAALRLVPDHGWMMADFLARVTAQRGSVCGLT